MFKRIFICSLVCILCLCMLASCSGKKAMTMEGEKVSVNEIEFFMSRMKGTLYSYGYDVSSSAWWGTIMNTQGLTVDEYYTTLVLEEASYYLTAKYLFEKEGLKLSREEKNQIKNVINELKEAAGSGNDFNAQLAEYGVNTDILYDIYTTELKMQKLKEHYFGSDGLKGEGAYEKKREFLKDNYVCYKQVFLASYDYECVKDGDSKIIYYTDETYTHIFYDKSGTPREDLYNPGQYEKDKNGDVIYYTDDGKIAYNEDGVKKYKLDDDGNKTVEFYSSAEIEKIKQKAEELAKDPMTEEEFEKLISAYDEGSGSGKNYLRAENGYYESLSDVSAYLDEIADSIKNGEDGRAYVVDSGAGFHIVYKYEFDEKPYDDKKYEEIFSDFDSEFVNFLFEELCKSHESKIEIDREVISELPKMKDVGINIFY